MLAFVSYKQKFLNLLVLCARRQHKTAVISLNVYIQLISSLLLLWPACRLSLWVWDIIWAKKIPPPPTLHNDLFSSLPRLYHQVAESRSCRQAMANKNSLLKEGMRKGEYENEPRLYFGHKNRDAFTDLWFNHESQTFRGLITNHGINLEVRTDYDSRNLSPIFQ